MRVLIPLVLLTLGSTTLASAQRPVSATADLLFYGDNTEFANPFRQGETLLGNSAQVVLGTDVGAGRAKVSGGVFGDRRFGADNAFQLVRPVFTLELHAGPSEFTFGTLHLLPVPGFGPDRGGPHGLLPPIQRDTMSFTRQYEAGLQWKLQTRRLTHEAWIDWQRLNTPHAREAFDVGYVSRFALHKQVSVGYQWHHVHHGGQLFEAGPVTDSWVVAPGLTITSASDRSYKTTLDVYALVSRSVPDRSEPERTTKGAGLFARGAVEHGDWRAHLIVWRGNDFIKEEGDTNYGALRVDGTLFRNVRDYAELGLTRVARPVPRLQLEGSARLHRVETNYEYSYRILARVGLSWALK